MKRKYQCPLVDLWRRSIAAFLALVNCTVHALSIHFAAGDAGAAQDATALDAFWDTALEAIEGCLYQSSQASTDVSDDERRSDDLLQIQLVNLVRDLLSPPEIARGGTVERSQSVVPSSKVPRCIAILQRGATVAMSLSGPASPQTSAAPADTHFAEEFAKACFAALLDPKVTSKPVEQQRGVEALAERCRQQLVVFAESAATLARGAADLRLVLQAIDDIMASAHRRAALRLFSVLIDCVSVAEDPALRTALLDHIRKFEQFFA